jgi:hypothetical protein
MLFVQGVLLALAIVYGLTIFPFTKHLNTADYPRISVHSRQEDIASLIFVSLCFFLTVLALMVI